MIMLLRVMTIIKKQYTFNCIINKALDKSDFRIDSTREEHVFGEL